VVAAGVMEQAVVVERVEFFRDSPVLYREVRTL
jgi:hypothetical protein